MGTKTMIANLKPLRADVSAAHQRVLDKLQTGARSTDCAGALERWRANVRMYLEALEDPALYIDDLSDEIKKLEGRLEKGFTMDVPDSGVDRWKIDQHFQNLLTELEVCCDLHAGHDATRAWLLAQDARLRWVMRRNDRPQPPAEHVSEMAATL